MKTPILILCLMLPLFSTAHAADDSSLLLQRALFEEEANHDLAAAVKAYEAVVADADAQRKLAATAVFRLGECFRKLGRTNDAVEQYQRVLKQFGDQTNLVTLSRQNLVGLGVETQRSGGRGIMGLTVPELLQLHAAQTQSGGGAAATPAQVEAHRLLIERLELELKAADADLIRQKQLIKQGLAPVNSAEPFEVRPLELRRQLILARDTGPAGTADGTAGTTAAAQNFSPTVRAQLKELLEGEIKVAEQLFAEQRKKVGVGTAAPGDEIRFERDVLGLRRQLIAADGLTTTDARKQWRDLLLKEIALAEKAVQFERQKLDTGKSVPSELAKLQRDVFALKRELLTFDATFAVTASSGTPRETGATDEEEKEVRRIQALIKDSPDLVNAKSIDVGMWGDRARYGTPLHKAAQQGQLVVTRFLIDNGADLDSRDGFGRTPLHWAAIKGHKSMAELLLAKGADPNPTISASAGTGSAGYTPLHFAADYGYRNVCEALLAGKASINAETEGDRVTPLHLAANRGFTSVAELLLAKGADVDARNIGGSTPLAYAAGAGTKNIAQLLLTNKANINARTTYGGTPLYSAVSGNHDEVVRLLVANKADPNLALDEKSGSTAGWTPLVAAISQEDVPTARLLLENGADPNVLWNRTGWTVLMQAASKGSVELVEALITAGADVNAKDSGDTRATALYYAASSNPTNAAAIVERLLKHNADANVVDAYGSTPLIQAVTRRNPEVVKLLVEHGADVNAMTRQGESPLSLIKPQRQQGFGGLGYASPVPPPGIPGSVPSRGLRQLGGLGQPSQSPPDPTPEIIALLEQRGARDDLRRLSAISTSRNQEDRRGWFFKGTNDWNHFTLLELIAWVNPRRDPNRGDSPYLAFPDLTRIAISRIDPKTAKTEDIRLDLATALANGDCAKDMPLQWGDVVDIPEQDHFVNATWDRFPDNYYHALQKCLERTVRVTVKGQSTNVVLTPFRESKESERLRGGPNPWEPRMSNFRLNVFLRNSGLLLSSSDVTRVKVKRTDPATKQVLERVFDLSQIQNQFQRGDDMNDLWLRDGDEIEVPEKDANRAAVSSRAANEADPQAITVQFSTESVALEPIAVQFSTEPAALEPVTLQFQTIPIAPVEEPPPQPLRSIAPRVVRPPPTAVPAQSVPPLPKQ